MSGPLLTDDEVTRRHTLKVLKLCRWNITHAARILAIRRKTIYLRLSRWGIERPYMSKPRREPK